MLVVNGGPGTAASASDVRLAVRRLAEQLESTGMPVDPTPNDLEALARMHLELVRQSPEWDDRVEAVYLSAAALASFRDGRHPAARVSPGEPFHAIEVDRRWVLDWYRVREAGVTLNGPPPHRLIPKISHSEFVAAARGELPIWPRQISPGMSAGSLAYAVLTICRSLC